MICYWLFRFFLSPDMRKRFASMHPYRVRFSVTHFIIPLQRQTTKDMTENLIMTVVHAALDGSVGILHF